MNSDRENMMYTISDYNSNISLGKTVGFTLLYSIKSVKLSNVYLYQNSFARPNAAFRDTHPSWAIQYTHWGRVSHICVGNLIIIGPDNGFSPVRRQAIIWTIDGILLIRPVGTNFSDISIEILAFHSRKYVWKCRLRNGGHFVSASMC